MEIITVGFSTGSTCFARLIRWVTRSSVSHTYVRLPLAKHDTSLIFQASGLTVNMEGDVHFRTHATVVEEFDIVVSDEQWNALEDFMYATLGKPYSIRQLFGMIPVMVCRAVGIKIKNPLRDGGHSYVCCELVAQIFKVEGAEEMTPADLLEVLRSRQAEAASQRAPQPTV